MRGSRALRAAAAARFVRRPGVSAAAARVVVTAPLLPRAAGILADAGLEVDGNDSIEPLPAAEVRARVARAAALLAFMTDSVDSALVAASPHLRVVGAALAGIDNFDVGAMTAAGVWLTRVPDRLTAPTAELTIGLALALARNFRAGDARVRGGSFAGWRAELYGRSLAGADVGVLGLGKVGRAVAELALAFGAARVSYCDPDAAAAAWGAARGLARAPDAGALVAGADFIFPLTPLSRATRHLVGAPELARARPGVLLINAGRGGCVDEAAVARALTSGTLGGYAADVFELEDWALADRPRTIDAALLAHPHTLFTPHLGSAVRRIREEIEAEAAENIVDVLVRGVRPRSAVNAPASPREP